MQTQDIFTTQTVSTNNAGGIVNSVGTSYLIERDSKTGKSKVKYARLSDSEHDTLLRSVRVLNRARSDKTDTIVYVQLNLILDKCSGIWGSRLRKRSTLREVLDGVTQKLAKPHKYVRGRVGEDLSVKQLSAFNQILNQVGADEIVIPAT